MPPPVKPAPVTPPPPGRGDLDAPPPLLGRWRNLYLLVLGTLGALVLAFWLFTKAYS